MQLEKTDGPTHPDDITGNDADAGKIPPPKNNGPSAAASGLFRQRTMPRHAWCGGAGKRSGAPMRRHS